MRDRSSLWAWMPAAALAVTAGLIGIAAWQYSGLLGSVGKQPMPRSLMACLLMLSAAACLGTYAWLGGRVSRIDYRSLQADDRRAAPQLESMDPAGELAVAIKQHLATHHGPFWRHKARLILILGEPEQIEALAPTLATRRWLDSNGSLLIWGGSLTQRLPADVLEPLQRLRRRRPIDAVVWAMDSTQRDDAPAMATGALHLRQLARDLRWQAPLYLWQVCASEWAQARPDQPVGCLLDARATSAQIEQALGGLATALHGWGMARMLACQADDFLLRLSHHLRRKGVARWAQAVAPLLVPLGHDRALPVRGLMFSLPQQSQPNAGLPHLLQTDAAWRAVLGDRRARGVRLGWYPARVAAAGGLVLLGLLALGLLVSFNANRAQIAEAAWALEQPRDNPDAQWLALADLVRQLSRLENPREWYQGFGLGRRDELRQVLWPYYAETHRALLGEAADAYLAGRLRGLLSLPLEDPARAEAYAVLKAYLMLAQPERVDADFLVEALSPMPAVLAGVSPGLWQSLAPGLWRFYAAQLPSHPEWRGVAERGLVTQARQMLLGRLARQNGEAGLYRQVIEQAGGHYPDLDLAALSADTEAQTLFDASRPVPGVYTRQAWEGQVRAAIEAVVEARREQLDWVLGDAQTPATAELSPQALKARLTARYFDAYASAWLGFLNGLRWRGSSDLSEVVEQLTLLGDPRQSPLIGLVNTLAWHAQAGADGPALGEALVQSARQWLEGEAKTAGDARPRGPLETRFGPLLGLLVPPDGNAELSLSRYLTRVTRVRLMLQQIASANDPQAMTQALAQGVLQGRQLAFAETRDYGGLLAASLGAEWGGFARNVFVQPLDQAWQGVLQPAASSLNRQWQQAIVAPWQSAFDGRYPFAGTTSEASLPMLGQMIRHDSGRIDRFLATALGGILRKDGPRWVAVDGASQGLRLNPAFLAAVNRLGALADVLYTDGGLGLHFELRAKPVRDLVRTTFTLDGQPMAYFNQMESWQRFAWPGVSDHPGVQLTWTGLDSGARLFADYQGTWGLIRLLERARATPLDDSGTRLQLVLDAEDGLPLTWHLRTELGRGPLALLQLRGFELPKDIFLTEAAPSNTVKGGEA
jgi:type VI secretion system protein ImpL